MAINITVTEERIEVIEGQPTTVVEVVTEGPQGPAGDAQSITGLTGDVTATGPGSVAATLANSGVSAGVYAGVSSVSVDIKGRVTALTAPTPITGATKTKITYDAQGRVTSGSDAAVADISGLTTALAAKASTDHDATHAPGGSDELPWTTIHGRGTTAEKPTAAATNAGYLYYDTTLSKLQRSNGTTWEDVSEAGGGSEPYTTQRYTQQTTLPANAASGEVKLFAHSFGNFDAMSWLNDRGKFYSAQPLLGLDGTIKLWLADFSSTTPATINFGNTVTGTAGSKSIGSSFTDSVAAIKYTTAAAINSQAGTRAAFMVPCRNQSNGPSWSYWARVFLVSVPSTSRAFFGLNENTAFMSASANPSASSGVSLFGIGKSDTDTNWKLYYNNSSGTVNVVDTGVTCAANTFVDFMFHNEGGSADVSWWLRQQPFGSASYAQGVISDNAELPGTTTALAPQLWLGTGTGSSALVLEVCEQMFRMDR